MWTKATREQALKRLGIDQHPNGTFRKDSNRVAVSFTPDGRVLIRLWGELKFKEVLWSTTYDYHYVRVDYPLERGYRMEARSLPSWLKIKITRIDSTKYVTILSSIHVAKETELSYCYSSQFSDAYILKDVSISRFL